MTYTGCLASSRCVQVLSRGNRLCAGKGGTAVLDFCNTADAVRAAFGAFWGECVWRGSAAAARARCG